MQQHRLSAVIYRKRKADGKLLSSSVGRCRFYYAIAYFQSSVVLFAANSARGISSPKIMPPEGLGMATKRP